MNNYYNVKRYLIILFIDWKVLIDLKCFTFRIIIVLLVQDLPLVLDAISMYKHWPVFLFMLDNYSLLFVWGKKDEQRTRYVQSNQADLTIWK